MQALCVTATNSSLAGISQESRLSAGLRVLSFPQQGLLSRDRIFNQERNRFSQDRGAVQETDPKLHTSI